MTGRKQNSIGDRVLMALVFLFLYAPIIILIVFSFNAGTSSSVWKGFSLKWYESLLSNRLIMNSVYTTLMVSLLSTIAAAIAGTFAAIGLYAMSRRRRAIVNSVNNIPMMNADIVTGVSLCLLFVVFFNGWGAFAGWVNSWQSAVVLPEQADHGLRHPADRPCLLQHPLCHPVRGAPSCARWTGTSSTRPRTWAAPGCRPSGGW